jgi:hypothetical protein
MLVSCKLYLFYAFVLTLLCSEWHPYKNVDGITTTIRNHLKTHHSAEYDKIVHTLKLKHSNEVPGRTLTTPSRSRAPKFDLNTWNQLLIQWIVSDDQVRVVVRFENNISNLFRRPLM